MWYIHTMESYSIIFLKFYYLKHGLTWHDVSKIIQNMISLMQNIEKQTNKLNKAKINI